MTTYKHLVLVHPLERGEPNMQKVLILRKFDTQERAEKWTSIYNGPLCRELQRGGYPKDKAIYHGRVNLATGELE